MTGLFSRRTFLTGTSSTAALLALSGCSEPAPLQSGPREGDPVANSGPVAPADLISRGSRMERIRQRGQLVVGCTDDNPLWSERQPGTSEFRGFDASMARMLARYIIGEPQVQHVAIPPEARAGVLASGTVDVVLQTYTITPERARKVFFAGPYLVSGQALAVTAGDRQIKGLDDLTGRRVLVIHGTTAETMVSQRVPTARLVSRATSGDCLRAMRLREADAYIQDQAVLIGNIAREPLLKIVGSPFTSEPYGIGLPHGDAEFKGFVNSWLQQVQDRGLWARLWREYLGLVIQTEPPIPPVIGSVAGS